MKKEKKFGIYVILMIIVLAASATTIANVLNSYKLKHNGVKVIGEVIAYNQVPHRSKGGEYYIYVPIVEFQANGKVFEEQVEMNSGKREFNSIGDKVTIYYSKSNPANLMIDNIYSLYLNDIISLLAVFSIPILVIASSILMSREDYDGKNRFTTDKPIINKVIMLILGLMPVVAAVCWLMENKYFNTGISPSFLWFAISEIIIIGYLVILIKFLLSLVRGKVKKGK